LATVHEYIKEVEKYPYTKEYFNLVKECYELEMMEMYLDSQAYMLENENTIDDETRKIMLVESTELDDSFMESLESKLNAVLRGIKKIASKMYDAVLALYDKIVSKITRERIKKDMAKAEKLMRDEKKMFNSFTPAQRTQAAKDIAELREKLSGASSIKITAHEIFFEGPELFNLAIRYLEEYHTTISKNRWINVKAAANNMVELSSLLDKACQNKVEKKFNIYELHDQYEEFQKQKKKWEKLISLFENIEIAHEERDEKIFKADIGEGARYATTEFHKLVVSMNKAMTSVIRIANDQIKDYEHLSAMINRCTEMAA